jgi:hypothetical protein
MASRDPNHNSNSRCPDTGDIEDFLATQDGQNRAVPTEHVVMVHKLAAPLADKGKLIVASYGQDPATGDDLDPKVEHFRIGDVEGMVMAIQRLARERHRNVYVPLAVMRRDLPPRKKGKEEDVVGVLAIITDFDDADAANYARRLPVATPYVVESSANRFQTFLPLDRPASMKEAKAVAIALKQAIGGDHCSVDMSHVWRVPGLLNWPNKKKVIEYGRSPDPQPVRVAAPWDGTLINLDDLRKAIPVPPEKPAAKESTTTEICQNGSAPATDSFDLPGGLIERMKTALAEGQRSENAYFVMKALHERDWSVNAIVDEIQNYPAGVGERYVGREKQLRADVARVVAKPEGNRPYPDTRRDAGRRPNGAGNAGRDRDTAGQAGTQRDKPGHSGTSRTETDRDGQDRTCPGTTRPRKTSRSTPAA